jgi:hypothetical protein
MGVVASAIRIFASSPLVRPQLPALLAAVAERVCPPVAALAAPDARGEPPAELVAALFRVATAAVAAAGRALASSEQGCGVAAGLLGLAVACLQPAKCGDPEAVRAALGFWASALSLAAHLAPGHPLLGAVAANAAPLARSLVLRCADARTFSETIGDDVADVLFALLRRAREPTLKALRDAILSSHFPAAELEAPERTLVAESCGRMADAPKRTFRTFMRVFSAVCRGKSPAQSLALY